MQPRHHCNNILLLDFSILITNNEGGVEAMALILTILPRERRVLSLQWHLVLDWFFPFKPRVNLRATAARMTEKLISDLSIL